MRNRLFHDWVNPKLDAWLLIIMSICIGFTSGLSTAISSYVISGLAANPADAAMCSYVYAGGMAVSFTFSGSLRSYYSSKQLIIVSALLLMFLNFALTQTDSPTIVILCTFFIGGIRLLGIIVVVVNLIPILMPQGERYKLYCVYYPISLMVTPLSGIFQVNLAERLGWHFSFHVSNLTLFIVLILIIIFAKNIHYGRRIPLWKFDWFGLCLMCGWIVAFSYVLAYGRNQDWLSSRDIQIAVVLCAGLLLLYILRNELIRNKILQFDLFLKRNVRVGLIIMFFFCIFYNLSSPLSTWMNISFRNDPIENASANIYPIYGYILGAGISFLYYMYYNTFKPMILFTTFCYIISTTSFYLLVDTQTTASQMFYPLVLRGVAIICSYITIGMYAYSGLTTTEISIASAILIFVRSYLGPAIWGCVFSNWLYYRPIQLLDKLASSSDATDPLFQLRFQGLHTPNADPLVAYKVFYTQASLESIKELFGWSCVIGVGMFIFLVFFPIYKKPDRKLFNWGKTENEEDLASAVTS